MPRTENSNRNRGDIKNQYLRYIQKNKETGRYNCKDCDKQFVCCGNLKSHLNSTLHKNIVENNREKNKYCKICDKTFSTKQNADLHQDSILHFKRLLSI
jgi:hypothetical protein